MQDEVRRLPGKYRDVVVLCYWEGLTQEQAAVELGCPLGTVRSRLARARDLLHRRLTRRGVAPLAVVIAAAFDRRAQAACASPGGIASLCNPVATRSFDNPGRRPDRRR